MKQGATDFITKPLNWLILCHRVRYPAACVPRFRRCSSGAAGFGDVGNRRSRRERATRATRRGTYARAAGTAQDELLKQERFSTIGHMTATVAHELRNPLGAIGNSLYVIRQAVAENGNLGRAVERAERSIVRCNKIINNLLDYTGPAPPTGCTGSTWTHGSPLFWPNSRSRNG